MRHQTLTCKLSFISARPCTQTVLKGLRRHAISQFRINKKDTYVFPQQLLGSKLLWRTDYVQINFQKKRKEKVHIRPRTGQRPGFQSGTQFFPLYSLYYNWHGTTYNENEKKKKKSFVISFILQNTAKQAKITLKYCTFPFNSTVGMTRSKSVCKRKSVHKLTMEDVVIDNANPVIIVYWHCVCFGEVYVRSNWQWALDVIQGNCWTCRNVLNESFRDICYAKRQKRYNY